MNRLAVMVFAFVLSACGQSADSSRADVAVETDMPAAPLLPEKEIGANVFQFGVYKAVRKGMVKDSAQTNTGKVIRKPKLEHVSMTDRVPLKKETYFGYQYRLFNLPAEVLISPVMKLRKVLIHPEMTLPDGTRTTGWDRTFKGRVEADQVMGFDGYAFNEDYELVEGEWTFQLWYKDKKLIERKFTSVRPSQQQALAETE